MKKHIILLIIVSYALLAVGCGNADNYINSSKASEVDSGSYETILNVILEIDSEQLNTEPKFNHKNVISDNVQHSVDKTVPTEKSITINSSAYSLRYKESLHYPISGKYVHSYYVDDDEKNIILVDDKGEINSILYKYTALNISRTASPSEVYEPLKAEISKIIDVSFYENVKIPEHSADEKGFGIYDYLFYNQKNDYITDYLRVSVSDDGSVFGLSINNLSETDFNLDISKEKENNAIESKLKDIYNTDVTQYLSYEMHFDPCITVYENQIYIQYFISAKYTHKQHGEMGGYTDIILVPLSAVSN